MSNLDNQIRQFASALDNKPHGRLTSDIQVPRQEDGNECKVVQLRSEKELHEPYKVVEIETKEDGGDQVEDIME